MRIIKFKMMCDCPKEGKLIHHTKCNRKDCEFLDFVSLTEWSIQCSYKEPEGLMKWLPML